MTMEKTIHGLKPKEVMELYHYLCIYECEFARMKNQTELERKYPQLTEVKSKLEAFTCNECNRESLQVVGLVPMDNLVSMTNTKGSKFFSFLYHLRNSIAHGQIEKDGDYIYLTDFTFIDEVKVFSARGKIEASILFEIIQSINDNIQLI